MKKPISLFMLVALVGMFILPVSETKAATSANVTLTATVGATLAISVASGTAALALTPGAVPATTTSTVTATSNDASGYNITALADDAHAGATLYKDATNTIAPVAVTPTIPATNGNQWGLYVSTKPAAGTAAIDEGYNGDVTAPVAISSAADRIGYNSATATGGENWIVTYKAAVDATKASGAYVTTVTYTIVSGVGS